MIDPRRTHYIIQSALVTCGFLSGTPGENARLPAEKVKYPSFCHRDWLFYERKFLLLVESDRTRRVIQDALVPFDFSLESHRKISNDLKDFESFSR